MTVLAWISLAGLLLAFLLSAGLIACTTEPATQGDTETTSEREEAPRRGILTHRGLMDQVTIGG